jgi:hypothetical protein
MQDLQGKHILFFAPSFFGYEKEIADKLRAMGAYVDYYDERPRNNFFVKASIRISRHIIKRSVLSYYNTILKATASKKYDYVFVVNLEAMLPSIIREFRKQQPSALFILYMWDSIQNKRPALDAYPYFDRSYSFDKNDAKNVEKIRFRPLFFIDQYNGINKEGQAKKINLCFMGTVHSDRYNLVHDIKEHVEKMGMSTFFFMYFPSPLLFLYKKLTDIRFYKARYSEFHFKPLKRGEILSIINESTIILDIQHPWQTGLTMRTIEMLGADKKLITTNEHVKEYDFYNPSNIMVIEREHPVIDQAFFTGVYQQVPAYIKNKYSIEGWIKEIFNLDE